MAPSSHSTKSDAKQPPSRGRYAPATKSHHRVEKSYPRKNMKKGAVRQAAVTKSANPSFKAKSRQAEIIEIPSGSEMESGSESEDIDIFEEEDYEEEECEDDEEEEDNEEDKDLYQVRPPGRMARRSLPRLARAMAPKSKASRSLSKKKTRVHARDSSSSDAEFYDGEDQAADGTSSDGDAASGNRGSGGSEDEEDEEAVDNAPLPRTARRSSPRYDESNIMKSQIRKPSSKMSPENVNPRSQSRNSAYEEVSTSQIQFHTKANGKAPARARSELDSEIQKRKRSSSPPKRNIRAPKASPIRSPSSYPSSDENSPEEAADDDDKLTNLSSSSDEDGQEASDNEAQAQSPELESALKQNETLRWAVTDWKLDCKEAVRGRDRALEDLSNEREKHSEERSSLILEVRSLKKERDEALENSSKIRNLYDARTTAATDLKQVQESLNGAHKALVEKMKKDKVEQESNLNKTLEHLDTALKSNKVLTNELGAAGTKLRDAQLELAKYTGRPAPPLVFVPAESQDPASGLPKGPIAIANLWKCSHHEQLLMLASEPLKDSETLTNALILQPSFCPVCTANPKAFLASTVNFLESAINFNKDNYNTARSATKSNTEPILPDINRPLPLLNCPLPFLATLTKDTRLEMNHQVAHHYCVQIMFQSQLELALRDGDEKKVSEYRRRISDSKNVLMHYLEWTLEKLGEEVTKGAQKEEPQLVLANGASNQVGGKIRGKVTGRSAEKEKAVFLIHDEGYQSIWY